MKNITKVMLFSLMLFCAACAVSKEKTKPNTGHDIIGWMHGNCLAIKNANLVSGTEFSVFNLGEDVTKTTASVISSTQSSDDCFALFDDRRAVNIEAGYFFYSVKSQNEIESAVGVLPAQSHEGLEFNECTTSEGSVFSVLKNNQKIWEGYYYLGYDLDATCQ